MLNTLLFLLGIGCFTKDIDNLAEGIVEIFEDEFEDDFADDF